MLAAGLIEPHAVYYWINSALGWRWWNWPLVVPGWLCLPGPEPTQLASVSRHLGNQRGHLFLCKQRKSDGVLAGRLEDVRRRIRKYFLRKLSSAFAQNLSVKLWLLRNQGGSAPRCLTNELVETGCCDHVVGKIVGSEERKRQKETGEKEKKYIFLRFWDSKNTFFKYFNAIWENQKKICKRITLPWFNTVFYPK